MSPGSRPVRRSEGSGGPQQPKRLDRRPPGDDPPDLGQFPGGRPPLSATSST